MTYNLYAELFNIHHTKRNNNTACGQYFEDFPIEFELLQRNTLTLTRSSRNFEKLVYVSSYPWLKYPSDHGVQSLLRRRNEGMRDWIHELQRGQQADSNRSVSARNDSSSPSIKTLSKPRTHTYTIYIYIYI